MGKPVDARTDIYSFGVLLYRILAGAPPFRCEGVPAMVNAHLKTVPQRLGTVASGIPAAVDRVVLRCLAKAPADRFASMAELADALASSLASDSLSTGILDADDPYDVADRTVLAPTKTPPPPARPPDMRLSDDETFDDAQAPVFDDTTLRLAATPASGRPAGPPHFTPQPMAAVHGGRLPPVSAPQKRAVSSYPPPGPPATAPDGTLLLRVPPTTCLACQALNPPGARVCRSCGIPLASAESSASPRAGDGRSVGSAPPGSDDASRSIWQRLFGWTGKSR
jgi:serine/threonine protein kinase